MKEVIEKTKTDIKELALEFGLKYNQKIFRVSIISKKDFVKLIYLLGCPAKPYVLFGKTIKERIKNYDEFICSKEFHKEIKKPSGSVVPKEFCMGVMKRIDDKKLRKEFKKIIGKLRLNNSVPTTVITKSTNKREKKLFSTIVFHEWIHVLLHHNNIFFQKIKSNYWNFDEGLTEYLQLFLKSKNKDFEKRIKIKMKNTGKIRKSDKYIEHVFKKLSYWNKILRDKRSPEDRYKSVLNVMRRMKSI